ncbi:FHA domain-containing protein [Dankookia rubra]|uniref:FHA domain-containing protein n=1 Tax=Dankookia rubra TaxID=1442381 RepID=UPI00140B356B|nr:FHA domain-containing protein [Dankookia rubra]
MVEVTDASDQGDLQRGLAEAHAARAARQADAAARAAEAASAAADRAAQRTERLATGDGAVPGDDARRHAAAARQGAEHAAAHAATARQARDEAASAVRAASEAGVVGDAVGVAEQAAETAAVEARLARDAQAEAAAAAARVDAVAAAPSVARRAVKPDLAEPRRAAPAAAAHDSMTPDPAGEAGPPPATGDSAPQRPDAEAIAQPGAADEPPATPDGADAAKHAAGKAAGAIAPPQPPPAAPVLRIVIRHHSGSKANQTEQVPLGTVREVTLGRDPHCTIAFDPQRDDVVSRHHAVIRVTAGDRPGFSIADLGSRNGTLVNGGPINAEKELLPGDRIRLGVTGPLIEFDVQPRPAHLLARTRVTPDVPPTIIIDRPER